MKQHINLLRKSKHPPPSGFPPSSVRDLLQCLHAQTHRRGVSPLSSPSDSSPSVVIFLSLDVNFLFIPSAWFSCQLLPQNTPSLSWWSVHMVFICSTLAEAVTWLVVKWRNFCGSCSAHLLAFQWGGSALWLCCSHRGHTVYFSYSLLRRHFLSH